MIENAAPAICCKVPVRTSHPVQFVDLTETVAEAVERSGIAFGLVNIHTLHTTTAIVVNENEPLLLRDMASRLERLASRGDYYGHDDFSIRTANLVPGERRNGHAHCKALFLRTSETLNIADHRLALGRWQRIFFLELDGPQERAASVLILGH